jgi:CubicO group peptidase (beta-lactamase class C family)
MNLNGGMFNDTRIINSELLAEMHKIHIETEMVRERVGDFGREGYGYGWIIVENFFGQKIIVHGGNTMVTTSALFIVPEKKICIAMASNTNRATDLTLGIPIIIITTLLGKNPMKDIPFLAFDEKLSKLTGAYETYKGTHKMSVVNRGGLLYIEAEDRRISFAGIPQGTGVPLIPTNDNFEDLKFFIINGPGARSTVEFSTDSKGNVDLYIAEWVFHKVKKL